ncbi:nucleoside-diphosphate kinase [Candidatus Peregrinibacteria bacterium]|nr:nucleoside-diphosphate kinase [Candidatus Peregrinibacteria bacterium]
MERTLVLIKPDALQRGLIGRVMSYLEDKGLTLVGNKMMQLDDDLLHEHYAHLVDKPFFKGIADFMKSTPVIVQCWEGQECVEVVRKLCGVTNARDAAPGTIRGDLGMSVQSNLIHASDSLETAKVEVPRFFKKEELFSYNKKNYEYIYAPDEK